MSDNPHYNYWVEQGKRYYKDIDNELYTPQVEALLEVLSFYQSIKTVLEFGCGTGRITNLLRDNLKEIEYYEAFDVSKTQLVQFSKNVEGVVPRESSILDYQPSLPYFDLVIGVEVLLHNPPWEIVEVFNKIDSWVAPEGRALHIDAYPPPLDREWKYLPTVTGHWTLITHPPHHPPEDSIPQPNYFHNYPRLGSYLLRDLGNQAIFMRKP